MDISTATNSESPEREIVDFVLVSKCNDGFENQRKTFEDGLIKKGLKVWSYNESTDLRFTFVQSPREVLLKYYDLLGFLMPLKQNAAAVRRSWISNKRKSRFVTLASPCIQTVGDVFGKIYYYFIQEDLTLNKEQRKLYAAFKNEKSYLFDVDDEKSFNCSTARIAVVYALLNGQKWIDDEEGDENVTLELILRKKIYLAAYPPHEGDITEKGTRRYNLLEKWAKIPIWSIEEPLDDVESYLGAKYAFYFAWLGCYTKLLMIPSIFGILTVLYGIFTVSFDSFSRDVCHSNITMCPACDYVCDFFNLSSDCFYVTATYLFDNISSPIFSFLVAIWTTVYLRIWKRRAAVLAYKWGSRQLSMAHIPMRAQYLAEIEKRNGEPLSFWRDRFPHVAISYVTITFFIVVIIIATIAVGVYRLWITATMHALDYLPWIKSYGFLIQNVSSAFLTLITISVLNSIYPSLALRLNELELHRTQTDFLRSLAVKVYSFKFVNNYSSILYIALFKGKFIGEPGNYNRILGVRQEECQYGSCLMELSFQLAIIMIGSQIQEVLIDYATPAVKYMMEEKDDDLKSNPSPNISPQCIADYALSDYDLTENGLFNEYLQVVTQFGFVTLFVPAFPLAPLCALIVNSIKIRLDARKILCYYQRPVPFRMPGFDIWMRIMGFIGQLSLLINGIILAFTSDFIPRLVYTLHNGSIEGFLFASLSVFRVADLEPESRPNSTEYGLLETCMYNSLRVVPLSDDDIQPKPMYWEVLLARFVFLILYQNIVHGIKLVLKYWIPEEPASLQNTIQRENREIIKLVIKIEKEKTRWQEMNSTSENSHLSESSNVDILHGSLEAGLNRLKSEY